MFMSHMWDACMRAWMYVTYVGCICACMGVCHVCGMHVCMDVCMSRMWDTCVHRCLYGTYVGCMRAWVYVCHVCGMHACIDVCMSRMWDACVHRCMYVTHVWCMHALCSAAWIVRILVRKVSIPGLVKCSSLLNAFAEGTCCYLHKHTTKQTNSSSHLTTKPFVHLSILCILCLDFGFRILKHSKIPGKTIKFVQCNTRYWQFYFPCTGSIVEIVHRGCPQIPNFQCSLVNFGFWILDFGLWIVDFKTLQNTGKNHQICTM